MLEPAVQAAVWRVGDQGLDLVRWMMTLCYRLPAPEVHITRVLACLPAAVPAMHATKQDRQKVAPEARPQVFLNPGSAFALVHPEPTASCLLCSPLALC